MKSLTILWNTMILQMKNSFIRPMFRFTLLANPLLSTILLYNMFSNSGKSNFINYVILGGGLMGLWASICFSSVGDIMRERWHGTLSIIYTAPADFRFIILGKVLGNTLLSLVTFIISFLTGRIIFGSQFIVERGNQFFIALLLMIISFAVISVFLAYLLTLSRNTGIYMNLLEYPILIICGFVFPIDVLPTWIKRISYILPPTWGVKLLRMSVMGTGSTIEFVDIMLKLIGVTIVYAVITSLLYKIIDRQVRIKGTLEMS